MFHLPVVGFSRTWTLDAGVLYSPWNDPQIDPEMIPISLHIDPKMIPNY